MAPRVNCEDAPECGLWSRKQHQVTRIKPYEVESMFEGEKWDDVVKAEDSLMGCMISEIQDPNIEDEVALHLAMVNSHKKPVQSHRKGTHHWMLQGHLHRYLNR